MHPNSLEKKLFRHYTFVEGTMKKLFTFLMAAAMLLALLTGCGKTDTANTPDGDAVQTPAISGRELKLSLPVAIGSDTYNQAVAVKEYVEEHTNGELTITIYPANQLGDWTQVFDELMMGSIDMAISSVGENYDPILCSTILSYLSYDYESCREYLSPSSFIYQRTDESLDNLGIKFLGFSMSGFDGIGTKNEIKDPETPGADKDTLIRVSSSDSTKFAAEALGFRTSTLPFTDTYSAIQTGVVDGWVGAPAYEHYLSFRDVENYYYDYNLYAEVLDIMVSKMTWDSLTEEQQTVIAEAMAQASETSFVDAEAGDELYKQKLEEEGITVVRFDTDQLQAFADYVRKNAWPKLEQAYGAEFMAQLMESVA